MLEGRVEICFNEAWGTICNNNFDEVDGSVICGQLGFSRRGMLQIQIFIYLLSNTFTLFLQMYKPWLVPFLAKELVFLN